MAGDPIPRSDRGRQIPFSDWATNTASQLLRSPREDARFMGRSLTELYSGNFRGVNIGAEPDAEGTPAGIRFIAVHEGQLVAPVMFLEPISKPLLFC